MKKRVFVSVFFILTFLLSSTFIYAPDNRPPDQLKSLNLTSDQVRLPTQSERWRQARENIIRREQSDYGTRATASNVELVGMWPYGGGWSCILDAARDIALIANGHTLQVLDIFTPSSPSLMGELCLEGQLCGMTLSGDYVYILTNNYLKIIDISDPYNPSLEGSSSVNTCGGYRLTVSGNYAYIAANCHGLRIYDISNPLNITQVSEYYHDNLHVNDVALWGNYAICDCGYWSPTDWTYGLEVVDISDPSNPSLTGSYSVEANYWTGQVDVTGNGYAFLCTNSNNNGKIVVIDVASDPGNPTEVGSYVDVSENRNFDDVKVSGNYAYVYSHWGCDLIILDISNPTSPSKVGQNNTTDCCFQDLYVSGDYVGIYFCGNFSLYDVSNRTSPLFIADYEVPDGLGWSGNIIEVSGDYVYMSSGSDGLRVMDVSDLSNPTELGSNDDVWGDRGLAVSGDYVYHVDCCNLVIFDISSPNNPLQVSHLNRPTQDADWRDIILSGKYAYISGMEWDSNDSWVNLSVIDISDPTDPTFVGYWVASTISGHHSGGMDISGDYVYLAVDDYVSNNACLKILDISNPTNPAEVGSYTTSWNNWCRDVVVRGNYAYLGGDRLGIFDISDPSNPSEISTYDYWHNRLSLSGDYLYLVHNNYELKVVDISDPNNPTDAGYYQSEAVGQAVDVSGNYAFIGGSLYILRNTLAPEVSITTPSPFDTLHGSVNIEAQASHSSGIEKVEIYIDEALKSIIFSSPFEYQWNTASASEGIHEIRALAVNNNGKSSDAEVEVTVRNLWDLTISSPSGGTTNPTPGTHSYNYGSDVQVRAFPDTGYEFAGWTGDVPAGQEMDNPVTITMDGDKSITANFSVVAGNRELIISSGPGGTTSPAPGSYSYPNGTQVWISANPAPGSSFLNWTGNVPWGHQSDNPIGITMDSNKSLTANFTYSGDYYIESLISPQFLGGGTAQNVQADDDTVTYILPFNFPYFRETIPIGSNIYICTNGFIDFAVNTTDNSPSDNDLAANKRIAPCWTDLTTNGSAQSGEDIYITEEYEYLSIRWVAETMTQEPVNFQVILYRDGEVQFNYNGGNADFSSNPPTIGISKGDGTYYNLSAYNHDTSLTNVNSDLFTPAEIDNPPNVSINNPSEGEEVSDTYTIRVSASDDNQVKGVEFYVDDEHLYTDMTSPYYYDWDTSTYSAGAHTIKAIAYDNIYQTAEDERSVTVRGCYLDIYANQGGTTDPAPGSYNYTCGSEVQITATPNPGYTFSSWGGNVPGGHEYDNPLTLTVDWDMWIEAYFSVQPGNYELNIDARYGGTTDPSPGSYSYSPGSQVTVTAIPDTDLGASFWYWQGDVPSGQEYTNPLVLTMNNHKSVAAKFQFPKTWTFMVYLDGDNDLESAAIDDFLEMASVGSDENINIVVQFDRISGYDTRYGDWTSTKRFYITEGMTPEPGNALQDLGELNHGDQDTLIDFINWGRENYPANYFALILWNHGGGWRESKEEKRRQIQELKEKLNFKDVCWDYTNGFDYLQTDEVRHSLWSTWYTHLIGFDACLMGMVEVAYQMGGYGSVMVGSEEVEPGPGWPYNTILQDLANNPDWDESELATAIVDRYYEYYGDDFTQSAIDLQNVNRMSWVIDSFAWSMINNWDSDQDAIRTEAQNVMTEIENIVIHEKHGSSWPGAHGLAIYFPENSGDYNSDYPDVIRFPWDSSWANFLHEFYDSMGGSWIDMRRMCTQQFDVPEHIDLYHFCELVNTESEDFYSPSLTTNDFIGGGTAQNIQEDDDYKTYTLPFDFPYFGEFIPAGTDIYISTNGYVDFENPSSDWTNSLSELANNRRIAVCWTDLTTDGFAQAGEDIYIGQNVAATPKNISATRNPDDLVIRWVAETLFGGDPVNVELVLFNDGRIKFNYGGGNADFSGQPPTIGISKGDGVNMYVSSYDGSNSLTNAGSEVYASAVYILTITASAGGSTDPPLGTYFYGHSESATITAIPDNYYDFAFWSEDASGDDNPITIIVDQNMSITANFRKINPPSGLSVRQEFNRSLFTGEYINVLTWEPNPANTNIAEYEVYFLLNGVPFKLGTVSADNRVYWHRNRDKTLSYTYLVCAVSDNGFEGEPISATIQGEGGSAETRATTSSITGPLNEQSGRTTGNEGLMILRPTSKEKTEESPEKVSQPLNFAAHKELDYSLGQERFTNVLVWQANPENKGIDKYRIYCVEGKERELLADLESDTFEFRHEEVELNKMYTYALVAVDKKKRECQPVYTEIK